MPWQCAVPVAVAMTQHWFRVRLHLGGLKMAVEIHKYAMYKNQVHSHKCSLLGNTNINWGEMAYFLCIIMCVNSYACSVAQIQVIIFDSHYSVFGQSDRSEILLIPYLFHNCTCIHVLYSVRHTTVCDI